MGLGLGWMLYLTKRIFWQKSDSKENGKSQWDSIPLIIISYVILEKANAKIIDGRVNWQKA